MIKRWTKKCVMGNVLIQFLNSVDCCEFLRFVFSEGLKETFAISIS